MASKVRTATVVLGIVAVVDVFLAVLQRPNSHPLQHAPIGATVVTVLAAVLTAVGAFGLNRGDGWGWPTAVGGAVLSLVMAVGAVIGTTAVGKALGVIILVLALAGLSLLLPLRRAGRAAHT